MKTGKTYRGTEQVREKERQRENGLEEREKYRWQRERKWRGLI
jgi:hypothetical protein